jgi:hypothetical protein
MYIDNPPDRPDASGDLYVDPDQLTDQAVQFVKLGDRLRQQAADAPRAAPQLGLAPPAQWFALRLAQLSGLDGAAGMIQSWADGLDGVGDKQSAAVFAYRAADDDSAFRINQSGDSR